MLCLLYMCFVFYICALAPIYVPDDCPGHLGRHLGRRGAAGGFGSDLGATWGYVGALLDRTYICALAQKERLGSDPCSIFAQGMANFRAKKNEFSRTTRREDQLIHRRCQRDPRQPGSARLSGASRSHSDHQPSRAGHQDGVRLA